MVNKNNILLVDDELDFLHVARAILKVKGYDVETASSAADAIEKAKQRFYDVAILDISLPDGEGTELLSILRGLHPDMLGIMLTGYSSLQYAIQSLNRGAFAYLEKPLSPDQLLSVINRGLEKQRLVIENRRLIGELEQKNHETSILLSVSQSVAQSLDLDNILSLALSRVAQLMAVDTSYIYILENEHLTIKGHCGLGDTVVRQLSQANGSGKLALEAFKDSSPVVITRNGVSCDSIFAALVPNGYISHVCIPLNMAGDGIGMLGVSNLSKRSFTKQELDLLTAIGREIAIAIRNSQLYEEASSVKALRELEAMRTEFLGNVSHELRTPLSVIKGYSSTLLQPDVVFDPQTTHEFLLTIDREADRLNRLIADLLIMSRLESGALEIKKERHSIEEVINDMRDRLLNMALNHRIGIDIQSGIPPALFDKQRIEEVITNLVENATKFSTEGSEIKIVAKRENSDLIISVSDNGIGIPLESQKKIFERFFQVDNSASGRRRGTGLGLTICRGIVEAHSGKIWVESDPGNGAVFGFSLPINN